MSRQEEQHEQGKKSERYVRRLGRSSVWLDAGKEKAGGGWEGRRGPTETCPRHEGTVVSEETLLGAWELGQKSSSINSFT